MAVSHTNLLTAIYARLTGDSDLNTALGGTAATAGRVWQGQAQQDEPMPYLVFNLIDSVGFHGAGGSGGEDGFIARVQFTAYGNDDSGPASVADIIDKLGSRLSRVALTVTSTDAMSAMVDTIRGPLKEEKSWRMDADYTFMGFEQ